jgi:hypothetical protein
VATASSTARCTSSRSPAPAPIPAARVYLDRRHAEERTKTEAIRCLKSHLAKHIWKLLYNSEPAPSWEQQSLARKNRNYRTSLDIREAKGRQPSDSATAAIAASLLGTTAAVAESVTGTNRVEFDSIDERALIDWPGVRGAPAQRLAVRLALSSNVRTGDRCERDKLDGVNLNLTRADPVAAAFLDPRPLPQSDRKRDVSGQNVVAQLAAELHTRDASR